MENKKEEFIIITPQIAFECKSRESFNKRTQALETLNLPYDVFIKTMGEQRKVLVEIKDLVV